MELIIITKSIKLNAECAEICSAKEPLQKLISVGEYERISDFQNSLETTFIVNYAHKNWREIAVANIYIKIDTSYRQVALSNEPIDVCFPFNIGFYSSIPSRLWICLCDDTKMPQFQAENFVHEYLLSRVGWQKSTHLHGAIYNPSQKLFLLQVL